MKYKLFSSPFFTHFIQPIPLPIAKLKSLYGVSRDQLLPLFHSSPLFSPNNILKFGDKFTLENIIFVSKSISRQVPSIFYNWFTFSRNLQRYETCWSVTNHLNIPTFQTQKYGRFSIRASATRSWNYTQDMLKINLSLKNSTPKSIKYFLTKYFIESY